MTTDPQRFRHRTPQIEAVQWTGDNQAELSVFCSPFDFQLIDPEDRVEDPDQTAAVRESKHGTWRGLAPGDWVVKVGRELSELSAADFAERYEPAVPIATPPPASDRAAKAEALLLHFTAEAHRRKWSYDRGLDDDGVPIKSEAFDALHRLGDEMNTALHKLRAAPDAGLVASAAPTRTDLRDRVAAALALAEELRAEEGTA